MKNRIFNTLKAFSACALLAVSCLSAQSDHRITVNIPFDFVVKNQHMSAGTYDVTTDLVRSTVLIRGENSDSAAFALSFAAYAGTTPTQAKVVFKRYGERYFLSQVWYPATNLGREIGASKVERELARSSGKPEIIALLASAPKAAH